MLKYTDIFQCTPRGTTLNNVHVLYKEYKTIPRDILDFATYDIQCTRDFAKQHETYVQIVNLEHAHAKLKRVVRYAKAYQNMSDMTPPTSTYVVNCPAWCVAAWKVVRVFLTEQQRESVHFSTKNNVERLRSVFGDEHVEEFICVQES